MIHLEQTLAEVVSADERHAAVLDAAGIDYCCGGRRVLGEAAAQAGVDGPTLLGALLRASEANRSDPGWADLDASALCRHIRAHHHDPLRVEVPRLLALAVKVHEVHGARHAELAAVRDSLRVLWSELEPHLDDEEARLFPAVIDETELPPDLMDELGADHEVVGALLDTIRNLTDGHRPPADACASYEELYRSLRRLDADTRMHVHKENNVLFPLLARAAVDRERHPPTQDQRP